MTRPAPRKCAKHLPAVILAYIETQPRTALEIAELVGFSDTTIRNHLVRLEQQFSIHRVEHKGDNNLGTWWYTWHIGRAPEPVESDDAEPEVIDPIEVPCRSVAKEYPVIGRRDVLVAALFGMPKPALVLEMER